jgi:multiple sugar transport system substrate-binding protein
MLDNHTQRTEENKSRNIDRRKILKGLGTTTLVGLSGCIGDGDDSGDDGSGDDASGDDGSGDDGSGDDGSGDDGDWPDLSGDEVHFLVDETSDSFKSFFGDIGSDFNDATGAEVRMEYQATGGSLEERLSQLLQSGDPPEVILSSLSQSALLAVDGAAAPVNEAYQAVADRYGDSRERMQLDGDDYMMPFGSNLGMFWYRTDLYEEAPATWETLLEQAQQVHENSDLNGTAVLGATSFCTELMLMAYAFSADANIAENNDGDINVIMGEGSNRDNWIEVLSFLQDLKQYSGGLEDVGCGGSTVLADENSAHAWWVGSRPKNQCVLQDRPFAEDVSAVLQPGPGEEGALTCGLTDGLITFKQANVEAAKTYMEFFAQPQYLTRLAGITPIHIIPPFPGIWENEQFQAALEDLPDVWSDHDIETMRQASENYQTLATETSPPNPYAGAIYGSNILSDIVFDVTIQERDPEAVIDEYAPQIQSAVDEAQE